MPTNLDFSQVIQRVYDESQNRLRTDSILNAENLSVNATPNKFSINDYSQYLSTSSHQILSINPNRSFLFIQNSSTKKVWIDFNQHAQPGFPSMQLNAGQILFMESTSISTDSIYAVAEEDSTPLIVKEG